MTPHMLLSYVQIVQHMILQWYDDIALGNSFANFSNSKNEVVIQLMSNGKIFSTFWSVEST